MLRTAVLATVLAAAALVGVSCGSSGTNSAAGAKPEETAAKTPAELCAAKSPCPKAKQTESELAACIAAMRDLLADPCLGPMIAVKTCAVEKIRCTPGGDVDDNTTPVSLSECSMEMRAFESCCAGGKESAFCP